MSLANAQYLWECIRIIQVPGASMKDTGLKGPGYMKEMMNII